MINTPICNYPQITVVDKHKVREFSAMSSDNGIVLCEKDKGSFIVLRYAEDLENLKKLLDSISITKVYDDE